MITEGDPAAAVPARIDLLVRRDLRRNRLTVFFRLLLTIPHLVVLLVLGVAACVVVVVGWFAALVLGRLPGWAHAYLSGYLRWSVRTSCYLLLVTDVFPPFSLAPTDHPVQLVIPPPGRLSRWAVLGRVVLVVPAYVLSLAGSGIGLFVVFAWFAGVFAGRTPRAVFDAIATVQRFSCRLSAYLSLLTPTYPWGAFGDRVESATRPAPPGWPEGYPYGGTPALPYPPMPEVPTASVDDVPAEPRWFTGVVTTGGRAIVIISLVLGVGYQARAAVVGGVGGTGGFGTLAHLGATVHVESARRDLDAATRGLSDGDCNQSTDTYCALTEAQTLDASLTELRGRVRSAPPEGDRRERVLADITALRAAAGRALDDGTLLAGGRLAPDVRVAIDALDHDLDGYVDRLGGR